MNLHAKSQYPSSYSFRDLSVHPTDRQTDMAILTRLVILIKNIYTLWGRNRFLIPVTYFPTNLVYPFTLRVTGITGMPNPNILALIVSEISALIRRIKNISTLWGRNRFLLPVTYFPTNLVYPFTLRVTGIKGLAGIC